MAQQAFNLSQGSRSEDVQRINHITQTLMPDATAKMSVVINIVMLILTWLSLSLEVFVRYDFGERYLGYLRLAFTAFLLAIYLGILNFFSVAYVYGSLPSKSDAGALGSVFVLLFIVAGLYHRMRILRRNRAGVQWHSMSFGVSRLTALPVFPASQDWTLYRFIEPVIFFGIGTLVSSVFHSSVGTWMQVASIALAVKNQLAYSQMYNRILDAIDAKIEAENLHEAAHGKPKSQTAGFSVVPALQSILVHSELLKVEETVSEVFRVPRPTHSELNPSHDVEQDTYPSVTDDTQFQKPSALRQRHQARRQNPSD